MVTQKTSANDRKHPYLNPTKFYKFWMQPAIVSVNGTKITYGYVNKYSEKTRDYFENMIAEQKKKSKSLTQFEK